MPGRRVATIRPRGEGEEEMPRGFVDFDALKSQEVEALRNRETPDDLPFAISKIGHVVLRVTDLGKSTDFYTRVLGFRVSDVYPESMIPGGMVFMRCNNDHHGVALVGGKKGPSENDELHHMAFEVDSLDEVIRARNYLKANGVTVQFEGRRRAGAQIAVEFLDPDGHWLEIYWGLDQVGPHETARPPEEWVEALTLGDALDNAPVGQDTTLSDPDLRKTLS